MDIDIEDINRKYDETIQRKFETPSEDDICKLTPLVHDILETRPQNQNQLKFIKTKHGFTGKNSFIYQVFTQLPIAEDQTLNVIIRDILKIKKCKSHSGVLVITVFTSPYPEYIDKTTGQKKIQAFSCQWNCAYCPNEPGQPRSYLKGEPGVLRANKNQFDAVKQMHDRMHALYLIGHPVDKLEVIVLGGTWVSYPEEYREQFCRDLYYAANIFDCLLTNKSPLRLPLTLSEEKRINHTAASRVIGLTLETRPDTINEQEIKRLRMYGCTRVQLGIQHLDEYVLTKIKRHCPTTKLVNALKMLKDCGFKVDGHFMPNLPYSSPEKDYDMFMNKLLGTNFPVPQRKTKYLGTDLWEIYNISHPDFQVDQWKVYPCATVPWTEIEHWYRSGEYVPYSEDDLVDILLNMKAVVFPWIRLNRIVRDIPTDYIIASSDKPNLRQELTKILADEGKRCNCIRCREIKLEQWDGTYNTIVREYNASDGTEYFISAESTDLKKLYGFVRLRIPKMNCDTHVFPELQECALIRELHVYGQLQIVNAQTNHVQHKGIGKKLMSLAEKIAVYEKGAKKMAVIAGEGTKPYYQSIGYIETRDDGSYMLKCLRK